MSQAEVDATNDELQRAAAVAIDVCEEADPNEFGGPDVSEAIDALERGLEAGDPDAKTARRVRHARERLELLSCHHRSARPRVLRIVLEKLAPVVADHGAE